MRDNKRVDVKVRFYRKFSQTDGCWEWKGYLMPNGYGSFGQKKNGKHVIEYAHRASWELHNGAIPEGLCVLHKCDNRKCVRPDHLFLGTKKDNTQDMIQKGRRGKINNSGENNPGHKLNKQQVLEVYQMAHSGESDPVIADKYGITTTNVRYIKYGKTWSGVTGATRTRRH